MQIIDYLILSGVALGVVGALTYIIRQKKRGKGCTGCCSSCSGCAYMNNRK